MDLYHGAHVHHNKSTCPQCISEAHLCVLNSFLTTMDIFGTDQ